ncbi:MAG: hemerythrin family protein [Cocleimonas sp.]|nr:hemerythrin family protein [Cocleimonas sp.]
MNRTTKMILLMLAAGILLVAIILTFTALGIAHPAPWLLVAILIGIPFLLKRNEQKQFAVWKDEYSVGVESLDGDHRKLLNLINNLQTAVHYQTGEIFEKEALDEVVAYTKYHFEREEKMLEEADYPDLDAHKELHAKMIAEVDGFVAEYDKRGHEALEEVAQYLKDWLVGHINGTDQEYSPLLKQKGLS